MRALSESRRFRLKILACMLKPRLISKYGNIIRPEYFERKDEYDTVKHLAAFWEVYKHPPEEDDLIDLVGRDHLDLIHSIYLGVDDWDLEYVSDKIVQFAREQAAKMAVLESLNDVESGDLSSVMDRLKAAMSVGQDIEDTGLDIKRDVAKWLRSVQEEKIATGMIHLDIAMEGGLGVGELGIFLAPPNYGKSMALINVGYGAVGPISAKNVVHFSYEMNANVIAKRYAARMLFRFPKRSDDPDEYESEFNRWSKVFMPGEIRALWGTGDVNGLRSRLNVLVDSGFEPELIIVDSGDAMDPVRPRPQQWIELGDIYKALRELGFEFKCPVWTASQTRRGALGKEVITMEDLGESFRKAAIADAIVAICQTEEEESNDRCRLFLAKLRDGKSRTMIHAKYFKEQQALITIGFARKNAP